MNFENKMSFGNIQEKREEEKKPEDDLNEQDIRETELYFKTYETREKTLELADKWFEEQRDRIVERLNNLRKHVELDLSEKEIDEQFNSVKEHFIFNLKYASDDLQKIKKELSISKNNLGQNEEDKKILDNVSWIENASDLALYKLLERKLTGELIGDDKEILSAMGTATKKWGIGGEYEGFFHTLNLYLFNSLSFDDYQSALDHEFTHHILNLAVPEAHLRTLKSRKEQRDSGGEKIVGALFSNFMLVFNESMAHIYEDKTPFFEGYGNKIHPPYFKRVHQVLKEKTKLMTNKEKDVYFVDLYQRLSSLWHDDMTKEDVFKIFIDFEKNI